jgi:hypothetical protein
VLGLVEGAADRIWYAQEPMRRRETRKRPGPLGCRESMRSSFIAAYRLEVCRLEACRHVWHCGRGRWVGRPEAGRDARRDVRRRDLGGDLDRTWGRRHCSR